MKYAVLILVLSLAACVPALTADILICSDGKSLRTVRDSASVEGRHFLRHTEAEWDAMPANVPLTLKDYGVVLIVDAGTDPSIEVINSAVSRARQGDFHCVQLEDSTRNDACTSLAQIITRVATPVCGPVLGLGDPVAASVGEALTSGRAKCRWPGGEVFMSVHCP